MYYTVAQVVTRLGYSSPVELRKAIRDGIIKGVKINACVRISEEEFERVILENIQIENSLTTKDVMKELHVSWSTVRRLILSGKIRVSRPRGHSRRRYVIQAADFQYYLDHLEA